MVPLIWRVEVSMSMWKGARETAELSFSRCTCDRSRPADGGDGGAGDAIVTVYGVVLRSIGLNDVRLI